METYLIIILILVSVLVSSLVVFFYRKGSTCKVTTPDPNASKYERDKLFGKCVIKTCKTGFDLKDNACIMETTETTSDIEETTETQPLTESGEPVEISEPEPTQLPGSGRIESPYIENVTWD